MFLEKSVLEFLLTLLLVKIKLCGQIAWRKKLDACTKHANLALRQKYATRKSALGKNEKKKNSIPISCLQQKLEKQLYS